MTTTSAPVGKATLSAASLAVLVRRFPQNDFAPELGTRFNFRLFPPKLLLMRVIAGQYRSRLLKSLKGLNLRPTSDYLREALFNVLGAHLEGAHFLDLFAGTGAVGIEALSRGAASATFIESHRPAVALIKANLASLAIREGATVLPLDALRGLETLAARSSPVSPKWTHVFLDPPYAAAEEYARVLNFLAASSLLAPAAIVVAEHRRTFSLPERFAPLEAFRTLRHGDSSLTLFRRRPA